MGRKAIIIGAGLGGLTTALRLSKMGYEVEIVEKYHQAGGRLNQLKKNGFIFDMAPTFFSMSFAFREFVADCGISLPFEFVELDPLYHVNFAGNEKVYRIYKDLALLAAEFPQEQDFVLKAERYIKKTGRLFHDTFNPIVKKNFPSLFYYAWSLLQVPLIHLPLVRRSYWQQVSRYFNTDEVKIIFSLVAFFLGDTPFSTPAVYTLLNYVELKHDGYYNVKGGMYKIVEGLIKELLKAGVKFNFNTEITEAYYRNGKMLSCKSEDGKIFVADIFVVNADAAWFRGKILQRKNFSQAKLDKLKWTMAPFCVYIGVKGKIPGIALHNYFLGNDFSSYAKDVFTKPDFAKKPYYYVNVPSKFNSEVAPAGCEALFLLLPSPDLRIKNNWDDREQIADMLIQDLSERTKYDITKNLLTKTILDPADWERNFNLYRGSGLGLAHDLKQIGYFRPHNKDEKLDNVYYVGASTVPGTGLPMVTISSKLVTERIQHDYH